MSDECNALLADIFDARKALESAQNEVEACSRELGEAQREAAATGDTASELRARRAEEAVHAAVRESNAAKAELDGLEARYERECK